MSSIRLAPDDILHIKRPLQNLLHFPVHRLYLFTVSVSTLHLQPVSLGISLGDLLSSLDSMPPGYHSFHPIS